MDDPEVDKLFEKYPTILSQEDSKKFREAIFMIIEEKSKEAKALKKGVNVKRMNEAAAILDKIIEKYVS